MAKQTAYSSRPLFIRWSVLLILLGLVIGVLIANHRLIGRSLQSAGRADPAWLLAGLGLTALTFVIAALIYQVLALKPLRFRQTVLIELASASVNRLLPAGIGGLGLHGRYLYTRKHTVTQATGVVTVNNALGMAAHLSLLVLTALFAPGSFRDFAGHYHGTPPIYLVIFVLVVALLLAIRPLRRRIDGFIRNVMVQLRLLTVRQVAGGLGLAACLTLTYTAVLWCSLSAIGQTLDPVAVFIIFSIGMLTATATPTPGGLVGAEAGLYAGCIGFGVVATQAAAAVLLYRLLTYWLPFIPGLVALLLARKRRLV